MHWKAETPQRETELYTRLYEVDKGFTRLREELGWARQTLTLYLNASVKRGCVKRRERGRDVIYSLVKKHPYVMERLGLRRVIIEGRVELAKLDEHEFVADWLNTVKFVFLNVIQAYMMLGQGEKESVNRFVESAVSDLVDAARLQGEYMTERIRLGELNQEKIWEARNELLTQIKEERRRRPDMTYRSHRIQAA